MRFGGGGVDKECVTLGFYYKQPKPEKLVSVPHSTPSPRLMFRVLQYLSINFLHSLVDNYFRGLSYLLALLANKGLSRSQPLQNQSNQKDSRAD